jgi:hypothetical protein
VNANADRNNILMGRHSYECASNLNRIDISFKETTRSFTKLCMAIIVESYVMTTLKMLAAVPISDDEHECGRGYMQPACQECRAGCSRESTRRSAPLSAGAATVNSITHASFARRSRFLILCVYK